MSHGLAIEKIYWQEARELIKPLNPQFVDTVDAIGPSKEFYFYRTQFRFGDEVLKQGTFHLPTKSGGLVPLTDEGVPPEIQKDLNYNLNANPALIPLNNSMELFVKFDDRIIPYALISPGALFGFSRVLDLDKVKTNSYAAMSIWDMTAGARSLFMLAKISDTQGHNRLKKCYLLQQERPGSLRDHWYIFREISQRQPLDQQWSCDMLLLPARWIDALENQDWIKLKCLLLVANRRAHEFWHNNFVWNLTFSHIQLAIQIKCSPHITDTIKHLFNIATGTAPGFTMADNEKLAPIKLIEDAYLHEYGLKNYAPILMQPEHFQLNKTPSIYYSLQHPTLMEFSPKTSDSTSTMTDLYEIKNILERYQTALKQEKFNLRESLLETIANATDYAFFHSNTSAYAGIEETMEIPNQNERFAKMLARYPSQNRDFPKNSTFLRGCIEIRNTNIK